MIGGVEAAEFEAIDRRCQMYAWLVGKAVRFLYRQVVTGRARLATVLAAGDVEFVFPGENSFAGRYYGKPELRAWIRRFSALRPPASLAVDHGVSDAVTP